MTLSMQNDSRLFPVLGMALYYCARNLNIAAAALRLDYDEAGKALTCIYFLFVIVSGFIAYAILQARQGRAPLSPALALLALPLPFLALAAQNLWPYSPWALLPQTALGLLWPLGLLLFFDGVRLERQGFGFGLGIAAGELVWLCMLPLLSLAEGSPFALSAARYISAAAGICMLLLPLVFFRAATERRKSFYLAASQAAERAKCSAPEEGPVLSGSFAPRVLPCIPESALRRGAALLWLVGAAALFFMIYGAFSQAFYPRFMPRLMLPGLLPLLLSVLLPALLVGTAPAIGTLLDATLSGDERVRRRTQYTLHAFLLLAVSGVPLAALFGNIGAEPPYACLIVLRQGLLLILMICAARLAVRSEPDGLVRISPLVLPLGSLCHALHLFQFLGPPLGRAGSLGEVLALSGGALFCLGAFALCSQGRFEPREPGFAFVTGNPGHGAGFAAPDLSDGPDGSGASQGCLERAGPQENGQSRENGGEAKKIASFAAAFGLTRREAELLGYLAHDQGTLQMAQAMGISERTVRFHLSGLLKKTAQLNRQRLTFFFASWGE